MKLFQTEIRGDSAAAGHLRARSVEEARGAEGALNVAVSRAGGFPGRAARGVSEKFLAGCRGGKNPSERRPREIFRVECAPDAPDGTDIVALLGAEKIFGFWTGRKRKVESRVKYIVGARRGGRLLPEAPESFFEGLDWTRGLKGETLSCMKLYNMYSDE